MWIAVKMNSIVWLNFTMSVFDVTYISMFARLQHNGFHHFRSKFTRLLSLIDVVHMTGDIYFEK